MFLDYYCNLLVWIMSQSKNCVIKNKYKLMGNVMVAFQNTECGKKLAMLSV